MRWRDRLPSWLGGRTAERWRGFNVLDKYHLDWSNRPFDEHDLAWIAELGFDFVRLPLDYRIFAEPGGDRTRAREPGLRELDRALSVAREHGLHVCLNLHRAPGWCINGGESPTLFEDESALRDCAAWWARFAERYRGVPSRQLSFNPLNEPDGVDAHAHRRVIGRLVEAIRSRDPHRPIVCDGRDAGATPAPELRELDVVQSLRGYRPTRLTHYRAEWVRQAESWPEPTTHPMTIDGVVWDERTLWRRAFEPWRQLERSGVRVFVGEFGAYHRTAHHVALAWMQDCLRLWKRVGWGWALWNFRGRFGVVDSERADVRYESRRGKRGLVDARMLDLLQRY